MLAIFSPTFRCSLFSGSGGTGRDKVEILTLKIRKSGEPPYSNPTGVFVFSHYRGVTYLLCLDHFFWGAVWFFSCLI